MNCGHLDFQSSALPTELTARPDGTINFTVRPDVLSRSPKIYTIRELNGFPDKEKASKRGGTLSLV